MWQSLHTSDTSGITTLSKARKTEPFVPRKREKPKFIPLESLRIIEAVRQKQPGHLFIECIRKRCEDLVGRYYVGTSKHWQVRQSFLHRYKRRVRSERCMLFDLTTQGKEPFPHVTSVHKVCEFQGERPGPCFFGEQFYLTKDRSVVESEKTALVAAGFLPSLHGSRRVVCPTWQGRVVKCWGGGRWNPFPWPGGNPKVTEKARKLSDIASMRVSRILERYATPQERRGFGFGGLFVKQHREDTMEWFLEKNRYGFAWRLPVRTYTAKRRRLRAFQGRSGRIPCGDAKAWEREVSGLRKFLWTYPRNLFVVQGETINNVTLICAITPGKCASDKRADISSVYGELKKLEL